MAREREECISGFRSWDPYKFGVRTRIARLGKRETKIVSSTSGPICDCSNTNVLEELLNGVKNIPMKGRIVVDEIRREVNLCFQEFSGQRRARSCGAVDVHDECCSRRDTIPDRYLVICVRARRDKGNRNILGPILMLVFWPGGPYDWP